MAAPRRAAAVAAVATGTAAITEAAPRGVVAACTCEAAGVLVAAGAAAGARTAARAAATSSAAVAAAAAGAAAVAAATSAAAVAATAAHAAAKAAPTSTAAASTAVAACAASFSGVARAAAATARLGGSASFAGADRNFCVVTERAAFPWLHASHRNLLTGNRCPWFFAAAAAATGCDHVNSRRKSLVYSSMSPNVSTRRPGAAQNDSSACMRCSSAQGREARCHETRTNSSLRNSSSDRCCMRFVHMTCAVDSNANFHSCSRSSRGDTTLSSSSSSGRRSSSSSGIFGSSADNRCSVCLGFFGSTAPCRNSSSSRTGRKSMCSDTSSSARRSTGSPATTSVSTRSSSRSSRCSSRCSRRCSSSSSVPLRHPYGCSNTCQSLCFCTRAPCAGGTLTWPLLLLLSPTQNAGLNLIRQPARANPGASATDSCSRRSSHRSSTGGRSGKRSTRRSSRWSASSRWSTSSSDLPLRSSDSTTSSCCSRSYNLYSQNGSSRRSSGSNSSSRTLCMNADGHRSRHVSSDSSGSAGPPCSISRCRSKSAWLGTCSANKSNSNNAFSYLHCCSSNDVSSCCRGRLSGSLGCTRSRHCACSRSCRSAEAAQPAQRRFYAATSSKRGKTPSSSRSSSVRGRTAAAEGQAKPAAPSQRQRHQQQHSEQQQQQRAQQQQQQHAQQQQQQHPQPLHQQHHRQPQQQQQLTEEQLMQQALRRYAGLRREDCIRLAEQKLGRKLPGPLEEWAAFCMGKEEEAALMTERSHRRAERHRELDYMRQQQQRDKPAHLRFRPFKAKRLRQEEKEELRDADLLPSFSKAAHVESLVEDIYKAEVYVQTTEKLQQQWQPRWGAAAAIQRDQYFDVLAAALRDDLQHQSRPVLTNEFTDYENPYMMKRQALRNLLVQHCTRNCLDEALVDEFLNRHADLAKLRSQAQLPPEALEPLFAFAGVTRFSFDRRRRLSQKTAAIRRALEALPDNVHSADDVDEEAVTACLPENVPSESFHPLHPFRNHFGFETAVPQDTIGGISMGKPRKKLDAELDQLRYPTLQRVAHSLPKDPKYRETVAHAIRVLERSRGWDYESKLKAINTLVEVYNNMAPGQMMDRTLDRAFPVFRGRGMVKRTRSRVAVFNKGLRYIRSLTTQKPLYVRQQKRK